MLHLIAAGVWWFHFTHLGPIDYVSVYEVVGGVQPVLFATFVVVPILLVPKHESRHGAALFSQTVAGSLPETNSTQQLLAVPILEFNGL